MSDLGQYFTTNTFLKDKVVEFILNEPTDILEPSAGRGDLVEHVLARYPHISFDMYEIDDTLPALAEGIIYCDFLTCQITKKYKTIIGNPPYVRTKKGNLYIDFVRKCYGLLEDNGELVFIVPSDFLKLTCASSLLNEMLTSGSITHIYHPHDEKLFDGASIDVIVFRYCKANVERVLYNNSYLYTYNSNGLITFSEEKLDSTILFSSCFDIYVGMVSGKDSVYKNTIGNIEVCTGDGKYERYIYINEYPCYNKNINAYMLKNKNLLLARRIKKFNNDNWYEWGAPRNVGVITSNMGQECIYIHNLTRKKNISFVGVVNYFGGNLLMLRPKRELDLTKFILYLNSNRFKNNFMFSERFKIGHRQLCNSFIPSSCF